jgi:hypothetical protein
MNGGTPSHDQWQPPWTQTGKEAGSKDAILYRTEKGEQAGQRVIGINDEGVEVSVPHLPYLNMLDPSGNVCAVAYSTNRDLVQADQKYRHVTITVRLRKGWVVWDYDATAHMGMSREEWYAKREVEQAKRKAKAKKHSARFDAMTNDKTTQLLEAVAGNQKLMAELLGKLERGDLAGAEKVAAKAKAKDAGGQQ